MDKTKMQKFLNFCIFCLYYNCISLNKTKSKRVRIKYLRSDVLNDDSFEIVGHSDILNFIKTELEKY